MGIARSKIYFEKGFPTIEQIRKQFKKQTGLDIQIKAFLNLIELPLSSRHVVEKLNEDIDKYERNERGEINYIGHFRFYNCKFYGVDYYVEEKTIDIEYNNGEFYFAISLIKVLLDLGGKPIYDNQIIDEWNTPKHWKKLKHWDDYKWYNRPRK